MRQRLTVDSPLGALTITADGPCVTGLDWGVGGNDRTPVLREAAAQLKDYFSGKRMVFQLEMRVAGSDFQRDVCTVMSAIPVGETRTYGEIAKMLNVSPQAVGQACGANPIPILIPCHRVMGAGGKLTGFSGAGGVESKVWLLRHEGAGGFVI